MVLLSTDTYSNVARYRSKPAAQITLMPAMHSSLDSLLYFPLPVLLLLASLCTNKLFLGSLVACPDPGGLWASWEGRRKWVLLRSCPCIGALSSSFPPDTALQGKPHQHHISVLRPHRVMRLKTEWLNWVQEGSVFDALTLFKLPEAFQRL